jgi:hypothetical protein
MIITDESTWWDKLEDKHPLLLEAERWYRRQLATLRHPIYTFHDYRKWLQRPDVGDYVIDCRSKLLKVVQLGDDEDDLMLEDGSSASWMHCCERPGRRREL